MYSIQGRKIVLTGGAGFIGSHIADALIEHGASCVRIVDNFSTGHFSNIAHLEGHPNVEIHEIDIRDTAKVALACKGMDSVCHQAALGSVPRSISEPLNTHDVNVNGFLSVLHSAKEAGIQRFVYASSSSVYGDHLALPKREAEVGNPLSPYAVSKKINEHYAQVYALNYGLKCIGFRYFNVFGLRQDPNGPYAAVIPKFLAALGSDSVLQIDGDGLQTRDFTFVTNAVHANLLALSSEVNASAWNGVYNVAVGENFTLLDLVKALEAASGKSAKTEFRNARLGDIRNSLADISAIEAELGYSPLVSFSEGIGKLVRG